MERNNIIEKKAVRRPRRVLEYWRGLILNLKTNMNFGTARNYRNSLYRFSEFLDRHDIAFSKIDADLVSDYELWLRKRGLKMNSVSFYLRCLRSVCNQAVSEGIARRIVPFQKVFTGVCATRKLAVPEAVFSTLLHWQLPPEQESLALSRDIFLFSYCARGMAFVDIAFLRRDDICGDWFSYVRRKTGQRLTVRIEPPMAAIINRYKNEAGEYVFPIISADGQDAYRQYQTALGYHNRKLKQLAEIAGISEKLSTYTARHSWATAARRHNVPLSIISAGLGHSSERTTLIYLDSVENVALDNANHENSEVLVMCGFSVRNRTTVKCIDSKMYSTDIWRKSRALACENGPQVSAAQLSQSRYVAWRR